MPAEFHAPHCPWPRFIATIPADEKSTLEENSLPENLDEQQVTIAELQQQVQFSKLLNQINNEIRSSLDLEQVLMTACRLLGQTLQCNRTTILVKESETEETFVTCGEYNEGNYASQLGLRVLIPDYPHLQTLLSQEKSLVLTELAEFSEAGEQTKAIVPSLEIRSILAVATRYQGQVNGIIELHQCDIRREWTEWEQQLLEGVASQLAIAINQAKLYTESRRQTERESLLRLVSHQIRRTLDVKTILQTAVREVRQLLNTDRVVIYQFQDNWQGEIVVEDLIVPWPSIFGDLIADRCFSGDYGQLYLHGRVRAIHDIHNAGLDPCHANFLANLQVKANLTVPIIITNNNSNSSSLLTIDTPATPNRLWGLLIAHECHNIRHWLPQEVELLQQLGEQMAIAIQQAELYAQVQEAAIKSQAQAQQLQRTLEELRRTQQQLIQGEKMSSLGRMVAGIAHEINNANNFIHANLFHALDYFKSLSDAIERCAVMATEATVNSFEGVNEELDLDYIKDDFPKLLSSMQEGSERIRSIVVNLRTFSHLDEAELKSVDLHEGLDSSLAILQHRLQSNIKLYKEYGSIPLVECGASQMNQVFLNLIENAIDAMIISGKPGELKIRTWQTGCNVVSISIHDNGCGIPAEIQDKIFDPFFTTKPIGKGTGLGLSVCYQIIQGHRGRILCNSQVGVGTEFIVELPLVVRSQTKVLS